MADVVAELVSAAIDETDDLTADQKKSLIVSEDHTQLRPGTVNRMADLCKSDPKLMEQLFDAFGSCVVRYLKS